MTQTPFPNYLFITNALKSLIPGLSTATLSQSKVPYLHVATRERSFWRPELMLADIVGIGIFRRACYIALGYAD